MPFDQQYAGIPNGTTHDNITAQTGQGYSGDVLNYPVQSGQLTAITGRTFASQNFVQVTPYTSDASAVQDYIVDLRYDSLTDSDFFVNFGGTDTANYYSAHFRKLSTLTQLLLWEVVGASPSVIGSVNLTFAPPSSRTFVIRHTATGVTLDFGGVNETFVATTTYDDPANKNLYWFIATPANANLGFHVTRLQQKPLDTVKPVLTSVTPNPYPWQVGQTPFIEPTVTAFDNVDGDITGDIVQGGDTVDPLTIGSYFLTYDVTDSAGNAADQLVVEVIVQNLGKEYPDGIYTLTVDVEASNCTSAQDTGVLKVGPVDIEASTEVIELDALSAATDILFNFNASTVQISLTGLKSELNNAAVISASIELLEISTNTSSISLGSNIMAQTEQIALQPLQSAIMGPIEVLADTEQLTLSTISATISKGAGWTIQPDNQAIWTIK